MPKHHTGLFSIVIPTLNEGGLLGMTIESILNQTDYSDYEILIVDDGSTDGSCEPFQDWNPRVQVIRSSGNGVAKARNLGARQACGEYIVFIALCVNMG
jgi:glycosyltransferase involved in cell wall biosynthesis